MTSPLTRQSIGKLRTRVKQIDANVAKMMKIQEKMEDTLSRLDIERSSVFKEVLVQLKGFNDKIRDIHLVVYEQRTIGDELILRARNKSRKGKKRKYRKSVDSALILKKQRTFSFGTKISSGSDIS